MPDQKPGDQAYAVAQKQLGKPYVYGATGPDSFDCSGLMIYSYNIDAASPHLDVGRDTNAQWNNQTVLSTVYDALTASAALDPSTLEVGDLILYFQPGNSGENAHVKMYAGGGQTIEAPYTGAVVTMNPVDIKGDAVEPLRGVKRPTGGGSSGGAAGSAAGGTGSGSDSSQGSPAAGSKAYPNYKPTVGRLPDLSDPTGKKEAQNIALAPLPDPRSNLPFSAFFTGKKIAASGSGMAANRGTPTGKNSVLVRGGMTELLTNTDTTGNPLASKLQMRKGGQFSCYFMMNPNSISTDCSMTTDVTAPSQTDPAALQQGPYWIQNQTISFELIFNRMYEVWQGGVGNPNPQNGGKAGPSDIGVRWDIRAVERLMGIYDAQKDYPGSSKGKITGNTGLGTYGAGDRPPMALPLQVVFGGANSIQFQGLIAGMSYVYTLFDTNMIPIEATVDLQVMRMYLPNLTSLANGADVVSPLVNDMGQMGTVFTTSPKSPFNVPSAAPLTRSQAPNFMGPLKS